MYFKDFLACHNHILACRNLCQSVCYLGLTIIYLLPKGVHSVLSPQSVFLLHTPPLAFRTDDEKKPSLGSNSLMSDLGLTFFYPHLPFLCPKSGNFASELV